ncbi:MAG: hypothetical protein QXH20_02825 [Candidatus Bathyarchaeia archaeon]
MEKKPKYANHIWTEKTVISLDSVAFLCPNCGYYVISDVSKGENPKAAANWINYPKTGQVQFRVAVSGAYHVERLSYYTKLPNEWKEWQWIIFSRHAARQLSICAGKDPCKLESWV